MDGPQIRGTRRTKQHGDKCSGIGCESYAWARGYCRTHYSRWRLHGDPEKTLTPLRLPKRCEAPDCGRKPHTRWKKGIAVCNRHWQMLHRYGQLEPPPSAPLDPLPLCAIHKCLEVVRSRNSGLCEKHYGRVRRGVSVENDRPRLGKYRMPNGYVKLWMPGHALAEKAGLVMEHRAILYEMAGGIDPECFWCGKKMTWPTAVVDHLNNIKDDNEPSNLVVSCSPCNRARGALVPFVVRMRREAIKPFLATLNMMRKKDDF